MTETERALLLAVAKHVHRHVKAGLQQRENLHVAVAAVEAEASFAAEDEDELAEVAAKARAIENIPQPEYFQALLDGAQAVRSALEGDVVKECATCLHGTHDDCLAGDGVCLLPTLGLWQPKPPVCPTCGDYGFISAGNGTYPDCPDCNGTGKKEADHG